MDHNILKKLPHYARESHWRKKLRAERILKLQMIVIVLFGVFALLMASRVDSFALSLGLIH